LPTVCCEGWRLFWRPIKLICLYLLFFFVFWYHSPNFLDTPCMYNTRLYVWGEHASVLHGLWFRTSHLRLKCTILPDGIHRCKVVERQLCFGRYLSYVHCRQRFSNCVYKLYTWKPTNASITIQFISCGWWLLHVSAYRHSVLCLVS
jgi:hypothetical protein